MKKKNTQKNKQSKSATTNIACGRIPQESDKMVY